MLKILIVLLLVVSRASFGAGACAPEMDPSSIAGGLALLTGSLGILFSRRKKSE